MINSSECPTSADVLNHVDVILTVNIGSDHRMVMSNIKLDIDVELKRLMRT